VEGGSRGFDSWKPSDTGLDLPAKIRVTGASVSRLARGNSKKQELVTCESQVLHLQIHERAHKESRAEQQHQRQRYLRGHQRPGQARPLVAGSQIGRALLQRRREIDARGLDRGRQTEK
jgi:hypothetical protein